MIVFYTKWSLVLEYHRRYKKGSAVLTHSFYLKKGSTNNILSGGMVMFHRLRQAGRGGYNVAIKEVHLQYM